MPDKNLNNGEEDPLIGINDGNINKSDKPQEDQS